MGEMNKSHFAVNFHLTQQYVDLSMINMQLFDDVMRNLQKKWIDMNLSVIYKHILHEEKLEKAYFQTEKKTKKGRQTQKNERHITNQKHSLKKLTEQRHKDNVRGKT